MGHRQALTIQPAQDRAAALQRLERAALRAISGASVQDMAAGCALFDVLDAQGQAVGSFAARVDSYASGREITITAAAATPAGQGITEAVNAWAEDEARHRIGARAVVCQTARRGLVRRLERAGWRVAGFIMEKET